MISPSVNVLHFGLLLQNHCANFNQTWRKALLNEGGFKFIIEGVYPLSRGGGGN